MRMYFCACVVERLMNMESLLHMKSMFVVAKEGELSAFIICKKRR